MGVRDAFDLTGKVAVVTGANTGLGEAFAKALADVGARVAIAARRHEPSVAVASDIKAAGGEAIVVDVDVTDPAQVGRMVDMVAERLGPIDILVNNAGLCYHRPALDVPRDEWLNVFDVNVHGLWYCAQAVGRQMIERRSGVIVNIGSISAHDRQPAAVATGLQRLEGGGTSVNQVTGRGVGAVQRARQRPGPWLRQDGDGARGRAAVSTALDRGCADAALRARPTRLGPTLVYLASDASTFMTGSVLVIDGGYTLW